MNPETQAIFEQLIVERGVVSPDQVEQARRTQAKGPSPPLLDILLAANIGDRAKLRDLAHLAAVRSGAQRVEIGGFELLEKIGQGGMGAVYRARQLNVGRFVALKLMKPRLAREQRHLERFLREARASARLAHPNIVQGIDAGQDKSYYYFAMEFVDGDTLRRIIAREGHLPEDRCIEIGIQTARALEHAAKFGMVHRDVKPENILIEHDTGTAKLADLGLVKSSAPTDTSVTQAGVALGTPNYISPEQARGDENIDIRSDIYSLGATLYHAATGTLPFEGDSAPVLMSLHMKAPLEPPHVRGPSVSVRFSRVIQKMMAKKREHRYQTPTELLADLKRVARGDQPLAGAPGKPRRRGPGAVRAFKRPRLAAAVAGISLAVTLVLAVVLAIALRGNDGARDRGGAAEHYQAALDLFGEEPTAFDRITRELDACIAREPDGQHADAARTLRNTADQFRRLTLDPRSSPDAWRRAATGLRELAESSASRPAQARAVYTYVETTARELMAKAKQQVEARPAEIARAAAWLDAVEETAPNQGIADEARSKRRELRRILQENADHVLDSLTAGAKEAAQDGRFGDAIQVFGRHNIPANLMPPLLNTLIKRRARLLREDAARYVEERRKHVWALLDHDARDRALDVAEEVKNKLGVPELMRPVEAFRRSARMAKDFLEPFQKLDALHKKDPKNHMAIGAAALAIQQNKVFGSDPYVVHRLEKYERAIARCQADEKIGRILADAAKLCEQGKYDEADAKISEALRHPAATEAHRREAEQLRLKMGPRHGLIHMLRAALEPRVPLAGLRLPLGADGTSVTCKITAVSAKKLTYETPDGQAEAQWADLDHTVLYDLAVGEGKLIRQDDARGLYCVGHCCFGKDNEASRYLLQESVKLAKARDEADLPGRDEMIASAQALLAQIGECDAEKAMKDLAAAIKNAGPPAKIERATRTWEQFTRHHGRSPFAKAKAAELKALGTELSEKVRALCMAPIPKYIRAGHWAKIVPRVEGALQQTDRIAPIAGQPRRTLEELVRFGTAFLKEQVVFQHVFSTRPWLALKLLALQKRHPDEQVVARAKRYARFLEINVECQPDAAAQRRYAAREERREEIEPVRDPDTRLARYNAVFKYWHKDRDECAWAEVDAAPDFRHTGYGGDMMTIILLDDFIQRRRNVPKAALAQAEYERLQAFLRSARHIPLFREHVVQKGIQLMREHRAVGDYQARFCLTVAEQCEALGREDDAFKFYEMLLNARSARFKRYIWAGYFGRGRIRERRERYTAALFDYEAALRRSRPWHEGHAVARAICNLCLHSGKLKKPTHAERAVNEVMKRSTDPKRLEQTRKLLQKE